MFFAICIQCITIVSKISGTAYHRCSNNPCAGKQKYISCADNHKRQHRSFYVYADPVCRRKPGAQWIIHACANDTRNKKYEKHVHDAKGRAENKRDEVPAK